jgi:ribosomal protein L7Ae-like RNA K-turn-binding protein
LVCRGFFITFIRHVYQRKNIIVGRNPVLEALKQGSGVDRILIYRNATGDVLTEIKRLARDMNVPVQLVPGQKLDSLTNIQHQGIVAFKTLVQYYDLQDIIDQVNELGQPPLFLMLDGITDVSNIGAIARTAQCAGVHGIIIPDKGVAAPLGEDAMKASAGALVASPYHPCKQFGEGDRYPAPERDTRVCKRHEGRKGTAGLTFARPCCHHHGQRRQRHSANPFQNPRCEFSYSHAGQFRIA